VIEFTNEYHLAAPLYGVPEDDLRARDLEHDGGESGRWLALDGDAAVGAAASFLRPDGRLFLRIVGDDPAIYVPLIDTAAAALQRPVHVTVGADRPEIVGVLRDAGLREEYRGREFRIRFDRALGRLRRAWLPAGYATHRADHVDADELFGLDCRLRSLTPGTDGWQGNRHWFDDELAESPPFDPSGYLVGTGPTGKMAGLVRIWRNPGEPSLGLIGVLPEHRHTTIAAEMLRRALTAASTWGSDTFTAATSPANPVIYPRMRLLGAEPLRGTIRFVRRPPQD
jgi:hypothetical protein